MIWFYAKYTREKKHYRKYSYRDAEWRAYGVDDFFFVFFGFFSKKKSEKKQDERDSNASPKPRVLPHNKRKEGCSCYNRARERNKIKKKTRKREERRHVFLRCSIFLFRQDQYILPNLPRVEETYRTFFARYPSPHLFFLFE